MGSLQGRCSDLNRALEESDQLRAQQAAALRRERDRVESVESAYREALEQVARLSVTAQRRFFAPPLGVSAEHR